MDTTPPNQVPAGEDPTDESDGLQDVTRLVAELRDADPADAPSVADRVVDRLSEALDDTDGTAS
ncbi:MAG: hypothetical protein R3290_08380 [Acidimicrobiia bacterium]|nr:hypothetical protein [Acidimicrobiia bacterium]